MTAPGKRIAVFLALTVALTAPFWILSWLSVTGHWQFGGPKVRELFVTGLMWCPGVAAVITCLLTGKPWRELGFELPAGRYLLIAFAFPLACIATGYALVWATGLGSPDATAFADAARKRFPLPGFSVAGAVLFSFAVTASIGVLQETGRSLGEEIGWRGFLVPELLRRHSLPMAAFSSALIWALWHFPLLVPQGSETPMVFAMGCFLVQVVAVGFVCAWLRERSNSLWPAVVLHSVHNALLYAFFDALTVPAGDAGKFAVGETGFACALVYALAAAWFVRDARRTPSVGFMGAA